VVAWLGSGGFQRASVCSGGRPSDSKAMRPFS
jgi:hypothetical protein